MKQFGTDFKEILKLSTKTLKVFDAYKSGIEKAAFNPEYFPRQRNLKNFGQKVALP